MYKFLRAGIRSLTWLGLLLSLHGAASAQVAGQAVSLADDPPLATYRPKGIPLYAENFNKPKGWNNIFGGAGGTGPRWTIIAMGGATEKTGLGAPPWASPADADAQAMRLEAPTLPPGAAVHYSLPLSLVRNKRYQVSARLGTCRGCKVQVKLAWMVQGASYPYFIAARTVDVESTDSALSRVVVLNGVFRTLDREANATLRIIPLTAGNPVWVDDLKVEEVDAGELNMAEDLDFGKASDAAPLTASPRLFGLHINRLGTHNGWPEMGQTIVRLWDTGTAWADIQPEEDRWVFEGKQDRMSYYVRHIRRHDSDAEILYTMGQSPAWASSRPDAPCSSGGGEAVYKKGYCAPPARIEQWKAYVRRVATRYAGQIKYFELWNEADYFAVYDGSVPQMVKLACAAKAALREVDPSDEYGYKLVGPSITGGGVGWLDDFLAAGGGQCIDIVNYHDYYSPYAIEERMPAAVANVKFLMQAHGLGNKPLWNTEGGAVCNGPLGDPCATGAVPSKGMLLGMHLRALATMWANGVSNFNYFFMEGTGAPWTALSEAPEHRKMTVSGQGFSVAASWIKNAKLKRAYKMKDAPIYVFKFTDAHGHLQRMVWSLAPASQKVVAPSTWGGRRVTRMDGSEEALAQPSSAFVLKAYEPVLLGS